MAAIVFNRVGKRYQIGSGSYGTLREGIYGAFGRIASRLAGNGRPKDASTRELWALRDVSFEVGRGEALGVIGPNGAGKTTILKLLAGVTTPTKGSVLTDGRIAPLIELGAGFHPELTGRENIYLNGSIIGMRRSEIHRHFDDIVAFAELEDSLDTPLKRYSSGMRARLGFAIAIHVDPDILLIDEVLAVGDLSFQRKCVDAMNTIRKSDKSIVFVSHNLSTVSRLCGRAIWLDRGEIARAGKADEVISAYTSSLRSTIRRTGHKEFLGLGARWGTGEAEILEVKVGTQGSDHERRQAVEWNDDVDVHVEFEVKERELEEISVWICIMNDEQEKVSGGISRLRGRFEPHQRYSRDYVVRNMSLVPGVYTVIVGLYGSFLEVPYDRWGEACRLEVKPPGNAEYYGRDYHGLINLNLEPLQQ